MSAANFEANLHSLVDDEIDERKRADILAKLALSAEDAEKLVSWRRQNQLLRAAFAGIEAEAVPLSLSLVPTARPVARPFVATRQMPAGSGRGRRVAAVLACGSAAAAIVAIALWPVHMPPGIDMTPVATVVSARPDPSNALRQASLLAAADPAHGPANVRLPDLRRVGFTMVGAFAADDAAGPIACGTYLSPANERVALCARRESDETWRFAEGRSADARLWHHGATTYSVAGDLKDADLLKVSDETRTLDARTP